MTHYPVPDRLVQSVNLKALLVTLDAIHEIQTRDPKHDERIRSASSRLEEVFGAYCTRPRIGGMVLDGAARFGSLVAAYQSAIVSLTEAFGWRHDDEGPGWNRWVDLSHVLHRGLVRVTKEGA